LGFVSERYPKGGALTLNTVSAIGLLSAGIVGTPILGAAFDKSIHETVVAEAPLMADATTSEGGFMWMTHQKIEPEAADNYFGSLNEADKTVNQEIYADAKQQAGRDVLQFATRFPLLLVVAFGLITLWFRSRGGYKPVEL